MIIVILVEKGNPNHLIGEESRRHSVTANVQKHNQREKGGD
jgi:hypothetical protein